VSNRLFFDETVRLQSRERLAVCRGPDPGLRAWNAISEAWRRYRSRQRITQLDRHLLKDIGVSFAEAEAEANKPFWRT
jgi:uncharacterized protein YjiS (DUF1127 family)